MFAKFWCSNFDPEDKQRSGRPAEADSHNKGWEIKCIESDHSWSFEMAKFSLKARFKGSTSS